MPRKRARGGGIGRQTRFQRYRRSQDDRQTQNGDELLDIQQQQGSNAEFVHLQEQFECELQSLRFHECNNCFRRVMDTKDFDICQKCKRNPHKFTAANSMDPGVVPKELQDLTYIEQLLIAKVQPVMRVYRIKTRGLLGQYTYAGNIINIGQNINEIVTCLPRLPSTLSTVIVRREALSEHRDFHVRRSKIIQALTFLKQNNPYYADITIDTQRISQLPIDDNIYDRIQTVRIPEADKQEGDELDNVYESFVPAEIRLQEVDRIQCDLNNVIPWPQATNVINEFSCEGYVSMAFPTLLPFGSAELNNNTRPNNMKLSALEYFQFLMEYKDQRFAQDPRFRFFALNTVQRHDAIKRGTVFAKKSHFNGTIRELRDTMENNPHIVRSLYYWCSKTRGSNSYWFQRRGELQELINQIDLPTGFMTLSAADLWWPDLARLMGSNFEREESLNEAQIAAQRQKLINENPLIVENYFVFRANTFMKAVVCKRYTVTDYWFRFEFQHRGSCHLHGVLWISGAPNPKDFDTASEQQLLQAKSYYDELVSAQNPRPSIPPAPVHPSRIRSTDVNLDDENSVSELLNRFQRHTRCTKGYCLKWNGHEFTCRFKFPKELQQQSTLIKDSKGNWVYTPARNDEKINLYNSFFAQTWRANSDFQIITSEHAVVNYIAKYASKSEPASKSLMEMFQEIVQSRNADDQSRQAYISLMMKVIGDRDISACETCHLLLSLPLYHCTRNFQVIVIKLENYVAVRETENDDTSLSFIDFYCKRPHDMKDDTLFEFAKKYSKGRNNSIVKCRKEKIVQVYPKVDKKHNNASVELYYKQQLMLHRSWRNEQDLKCNEETWKNAFERSNVVELQQLDMSSASVDDEDTDQTNDQEAIFNDRDWMAVTTAMPNALPAHVSLGNRDIDILHDWYAVFHQYPDIKNKINFIERCRETTENGNENFLPSNIIFNEEQNTVLSFLDHQLSTYDDCLHKLAIIQGKAGTGKSCVINQMVYKINSHFNCSATVLLAPTGVAANNINGQTIHSALRIPASKSALPQLGSEAKIMHQEEFKDVRFVIIDEASMLGLRLFFKVDKRLREAKPLTSHLPFGGLCVYLVGDWSQLPPVCDWSLYGIGRNPNEIQSSLLYSQFNKVFFLTQIMRQQGEEQKSFRESLNRISNGTITERDYQLLSYRFYVNNIGDKSFKDSVCIMSRNAQIDKFNYDKLEDNKQPIALIKAVHNCPEAAAASSDDAQGLSAELRLCKGARIILRRNLWVLKGLANGSVGTVVDIIYDPSIECEIYSDYMPLCILVHFEKYTGPTIYGNSVPIIPMTSSFKKQGISCSRKQFPIMLGYAVSIHRSQGITLEKAIVDIGDSEFQVGLTYVALSRVKTLSGLLLKPSFNFDRLLKINNSSGMVGRRDELQRLWNLANRN